MNTTPHPRQMAILKPHGLTPSAFCDLPETGTGFFTEAAIAQQLRSVENPVHIKRKAL